MRWSSHDAKGERITIDIGTSQDDGLGRVFTVVTDCASAVGASLTAVTVIETVAGFESTVPSFALNVKLSGPL